jgi:hypothetical protein
MFLTRRPHLSANSVVCDAARINALGLRDKIHGGNKTDAYVDLALPGGMNIASRLISPRSTASSFELISL